MANETSGPAMSKDNLVWLDMEMTGLDPKTCVPLQVGIVITGADLEREYEALEITIWQPESALETMDPYVRRMHMDNGLLEEVRKSELGLGYANDKMMSILSRWCPYRQGILAGNSIHTDRRFLAEYFPAFDGYLHYRMVDVSSFKEMMRRWYGPEGTFQKGPGLHTALADLRESIAELKHYRSMTRKPGAASTG